MARRDKLRRMMGVNDKGKPTKRPALPPADDEGFNDAVRETLEQLQGQRGDELDQAVTFRDLEDGALSKRMVERGIDAGAKIKVGVDDGAMVGGFDSRDDGMPRPTYPYEAENIEANAAYTRIIISWDIPRIGNYAYSEVYRAETDSVSEARLIGSTRSGIYTDVTGGGFTGYYWIKIVNDLGNRSEFAGGVSATTPLDFDVIRDAATSRAWQKNHDYSIYNAVIPTTGVTYIGDDAVVFIAQSGGISGNTEPNWSSITAFGQIINDNGIQWKAVEAAKIPFMIDAETGLTVIEGAAIRKASIKIAQIQEAFIDNLVAAQGTIDIANIGQGNIFDLAIGGKIASKNFNRGRYGFEITENGDAEFNDVTMRGALTNGVINQNNGRITGGQYIDFRRGVYDQYGSETNGDFVLGNTQTGETIEYKWDNDLKRKVMKLNVNLLKADIIASSQVFHRNNLSSSLTFDNRNILQSSDGFGGNYRIGNRDFGSSASIPTPFSVQLKSKTSVGFNHAHTVRKFNHDLYERIGWKKSKNYSPVYQNNIPANDNLFVRPTNKRTQTIKDVSGNNRPFKVVFMLAPMKNPATLKTGSTEPDWNSAKQATRVSVGSLRYDLVYFDDGTSYSTDMVPQGNPGQVVFPPRYYVKDGSVVWVKLLISEAYELDISSPYIFLWTNPYSPRGFWYEEEPSFGIDVVNRIEELTNINQKSQLLKSTYMYRNGRINVECKIEGEFGGTGSRRVAGAVWANAAIPIIALVVNNTIIDKVSITKCNFDSRFKNTTVTEVKKDEHFKVTTTFKRNNIAIRATDQVEIRVYYGCYVGASYSPSPGSIVPSVGFFGLTISNSIDATTIDAGSHGSFSPYSKLTSSDLTILASEPDDTVSIK